MNICILASDLGKKAFGQGLGVKICGLAGGLGRKPLAQGLGRGLE